MSPAATPARPFPVVLDLTEDSAYTTIVLALSSYADKCEGEAADDEESAAYNGMPAGSRATYLREVAAEARGLVEDVERQLDESGKANRS